MIGIRPRGSWDGGPGGNGCSRLGGKRCCCGGGGGGGGACWLNDCP